MMVFQDGNSDVVNEAVCIHNGPMISYNTRLFERISGTQKAEERMEP
jgi:hypothetical protein